MPTPAGLTTVTVTGQAVTIDGAPIDDAVFICEHWLIGPAADLAVAPFKIHALLGEDGSFDVDLPATDDPAWTPQDWTYTVRLARGSKFVYGRLSVPYDGGPFDLADRLNLDQGDVEPNTYVTLAMRGAANGVAALDGTGKVPAAQLPASAGGDPAWDDITGKPSTFPPSAHTHTIANVTGLQTALDAKASVTQLDAATDAIEFDVADLDVRVTALEDAPGGGGSSVVVKQAINTTAGNVVPQAAAGWEAVTGGPTITIAAAAGDYVSLEVLGSLIKTLSNNFLELAVMVAGAPVRYGSKNTNTPSTEGDPAMYSDFNFRTFGLGMAFVAEAGDISSGSITFGFATKGVGTGTTIYSSTDYPLRWRAMNYGAVSVS